MPFEMIGKYELIESLGRGTSANVYLAKDTRLRRQVALKVVEPETNDFGPFFKEAQLLVRLNHPNIVKVNSADEMDGKVVIDMEYVPGPSLKRILRDEKRLPMERALNIIAQLLKVSAQFRTAALAPS
jgi:serine/threonine-protein kinase